MIYANLIRTYDGKRSLFEAARVLDAVTVRTDMVYGRGRGFWGGSPILEVVSQPGTVTPGVAALTESVQRSISNPVPVLFDLIMQSIEESWRQDAFHLVLHSSGWDTRIISGCIKELLKKNGPEWLGQGLLFLCNRWEADRFVRIMEAMGWQDTQYVAYVVGEPEEHFAELVYDVWRCAPLPRPANFLWYLPEWAEKNGLIPSRDVQVYTGLWANEVWQCFIQDNQDWPRRVRKKYGVHMIASMPIRADWVEYPLVTLPVLDILRRSHVVGTDGNGLRRMLSEFACPEARAILRRNVSDGYHHISQRLQDELNDYYSGTEFGKRVGWQVPTHSGNVTDWARWSVALLVEKLASLGVEVAWA